MTESVENLLDRAMALQRRGERSEAARLCREALATWPDDAEAWHLSGLLAHEAGKLEAAVEHLGRAAGLAPDVAVYRVNLGAVLCETGQSEAAVAALREAVRLAPALPQAHYNLGNALLAAGEEGEAMACYRRAALLKPDHAEALNNIGLILHKRGELELAVDHYRLAAGGDDSYAPALSNLCAALAELGRHDEAIAAGRAAAVAAPDDPDVHYNLGNAFSGAFDPDSAAECYRAAVGRAPRHADAWCNLGVAELARHRPEQAIEALDRAMALKPEMADARWNKALALLIQGKFKEGWPLYEARWEVIPWLERRKFPQAEWTGEAIEGQTVLVHAEQGYGDTLQFVRFLPEIKRRGGRVVLACQPALKRLLALLPDVETVVAYGEPMPAFDLHLPIMSLPRVIGLDRIVPPERPYLRSAGDPPAAFQAIDRPRIGFVWRGSQLNPRGAGRSCRLSDIEPLLARFRTNFFSLQVDAGEPDRETLRRLGVVDLSPWLGDFLDTAGVVATLDLVISVDTVLAHLAGGLGVPVWTLVPLAADWRWQIGREDSPWYPTMRLYRQTRRGDWSGPVDRVAHDIADLMAAHRR